MKSRHWKKGI